MAALRANLWLPSLGALLSPSSEGRASRNAPKLPSGRGGTPDKWRPDAMVRGSRNLRLHAASELKASCTGRG